MHCTKIHYFLIIHGSLKKAMYNLPQNGYTVNSLYDAYGNTFIETEDRQIPPLTVFYFRRSETTYARQFTPAADTGSAFHCKVCAGVSSPFCTPGCDKKQSGGFVCQVVIKVLYPALRRACSMRTALFNISKAPTCTRYSPFSKIRNAGKPSICSFCSWVLALARFL